MQPGTVSRDVAAACWLTGERCRSCRLTLRDTPEASERSFRIAHSTATPSSAIAIAVQQLSAWLRCLATCALPRSSRPLWRTFCSPAALPSHCGLKELLRVERRAPLSPPWLSTSASCNPAVPNGPNFCHVVCGIVSGHYRHLIPDLQDLESGSPDVPTRRLSTLPCPRRLPCRTLRHCS